MDVLSIPQIQVIQRTAEDVTLEEEAAYLERIRDRGAVEFGVNCCGQFMEWRGDVAICLKCRLTELAPQQWWWHGVLAGRPEDLRRIRASPTPTATAMYEVADRD